MKVRKPMRLEESLINKVEKHVKGDIFTSKMEFILNDYFNTIDERKKELKEIEKKIDEKDKEYQRLVIKINKAKRKFEDCIRDILYS